MKPRNQDPKENKSGVIYSFQCNHITCNEEYIGEIARTLGKRCKKHLKQSSPIHAHIQQTGHSTTEASFNIIGRQDQGQARTIKESIFIRVYNQHLSKTLISTISVIYGTESFLTPQGLNWALPNRLAYKNNLGQLSVDFLSYCWINLVEVWYSLEQYIGL